MKNLIAMIMVVVLIIISIAVLIDLLTYGVYPVSRLIIFIISISMISGILYFRVRSSNQNAR